MVGLRDRLWQEPRLRSIPTRVLAALQKETQSAKTCLGLPEDVQLVSCYKAGLDSFWLDRYLHSRPGANGRYPFPSTCKEAAGFCGTGRSFSWISPGLRCPN